MEQLQPGGNKTQLQSDRAGVQSPLSVARGDTGARERERKRRGRSRRSRRGGDGAGRATAVESRGRGQDQDRRQAPCGIRTQRQSGAAPVPGRPADPQAETGRPLFRGRPPSSHAAVVPPHTVTRRGQPRVAASTGSSTRSKSRSNLTDGWRKEAEPLCACLIETREEEGAAGTNPIFSFFQQAVQERAGRTQSAAPLAGNRRGDTLAAAGEVPRRRGGRRRVRGDRVAQPSRRPDRTHGLRRQTCPDPRRHHRPPPSHHVALETTRHSQSVTREWPRSLARKTAHGDSVRLDNSYRGNRLLARPPVPAARLINRACIVVYKLKSSFESLQSR